MRLQADVCNNHFELGKHNVQQGQTVTNQSKIMNLKHIVYKISIWSVYDTASFIVLGLTENYHLRDSVKNLLS